MDVAAQGIARGLVMKHNPLAQAPATETSLTRGISQRYSQWAQSNRAATSAAVRNEEAGVGNWGIIGQLFSGQGRRGEAGSEQGDVDGGGGRVEDVAAAAVAAVDAARAAAAAAEVQAGGAGSGGSAWSRGSRAAAAAAAVRAADAALATLLSTISMSPSVTAAAYGSAPSNAQPLARESTASLGDCLLGLPPQPGVCGGVGIV